MAGSSCYIRRPEFACRSRRLLVSPVTAFAGARHPEDQKEHEKEVANLNNQGTNDGAKNCLPPGTCQRKSSGGERQQGSCHTQHETRQWHRHPPPVKAHLDGCWPVLRQFFGSDWLPAFCYLDRCKNVDVTPAGPDRFPQPKGYGAANATHSIDEGPTIVAGDKNDTGAFRSGETPLFPIHTALIGKSRKPQDRKSRIFPYIPLSY